ncbi:class I SAM-dependent methyltransferase [Salinibacterium sp. dk2585]|uniref:class I SAM-dependent methyltransferase n=1 Tax=unclassified Salinibacterium TaxID=2632331 RepID=UPI0011C256B9|nr:MULTISPECIES: class I SAM-dependent methyltransferase [unclassified Salinibacterium]QEE60560.1 class I SAM-dependent methyltransferase [Salinibacterium sp. dk2585]TXK55632.1 class I SAM-dependent methyltransferase [Salinibacterium sp. dk5596]
MSESAAQRRMTRYWSARALAYDESQTRRQRLPGALEVWRGVWDASLPPAPAEVLDLGTGSGNVAHLLASLGHRVVGIDLAQGMLAQARAKKAFGSPAPRFRCGDAVSPPFAAGAFDALTCRYLLWTLRDPGRAFAAWLRLLRPGGVLVAVDSCWYPSGIAASDAGHGPEPDGEFAAAYDPEAVQHLPFAEAPDFTGVTELLRHTGFAEVETAPLPSVLALDERHGVAPGHPIQMQYRITARRP